MKRCFITIALLLLPALATAEEWGQFLGTVRAEWLEDGRRMRLLDNFGYRDPAGRTWTTPRGTIVDGASIPRVFWTYIGGPFEGKYRNASVLHDFECDERKRPWKAVHRLFYNASRRAAVGPIKAKIMYGAVFHFGPRWEQHASILSMMAEGRALRTDEDFLRMAELIERNGEISLEAIEGLTAERLQELVPEPRRRPHQRVGEEND